MTDFDTPEFRSAVAAVVQPGLDEMAAKIAEQAASKGMVQRVDQARWSPPMLLGRTTRWAFSRAMATEFQSVHCSASL